jgi:phosphotransferase system HPr (HPr) family protein
MQAGEDTLEKLVGEVTVEIKNANGFHLRPAMQFVDLASQFDCKITVSNGKVDADGKSIMAMCGLLEPCGARWTITAEGPEAEMAVAALREMVEVRMFDEPGPEGQA